MNKKNSIKNVKAVQQRKTFEIDVDKIKNFDDLKIILKHMGLVFSPPTIQAYEEMKPYLKDEENN